MGNIGYCGLDDSVCSVHMTTTRIDIGKQKHVVHEYSVPTCQFLESVWICLASDSEQRKYVKIVAENNNSVVAKYKQKNSAFF